jgi:hypothetical protein
VVVGQAASIRNVGVAFKVRVLSFLVWHGAISFCWCSFTKSERELDLIDIGVEPLI